MDIGFDPFALAVSLVAVWFTINESRKSNTVKMKIMKCQTTISHRPGFGGVKEDHHFSILIRNQGISLHDPKLAFMFKTEDGLATMSVPLNRRDERTGKHSEFARGMIAEFGLLESEVNETGRQILSMIKELHKHQPVFMLYSQGYTAKIIKIGGPSDKFALWWNRIAYRFNRRFDKKIGEHGLKMGNVLPGDLVELSIPLKFFAQQFRAQAGAPGGTDHVRTSKGA